MHALLTDWIAKLHGSDPLLYQDQHLYQGRRKENNTGEAIYSGVGQGRGGGGGGGGGACTNSLPPKIKRVSIGNA